MTPRDEPTAANSVARPDGPGSRADASSPQAVSPLPGIDPSRTYLSDWLEPGVADGRVAAADVIRVSIAVSLKRIADALARAS